jgi:hypothetical protein
MFPAYCENLIARLMGQRASDPSSDRQEFRKSRKQWSEVVTREPRLACDFPNPVPIL